MKNFLALLLLSSTMIFAQEADSLKEYKLPSLNVSASKAQSGLTPISFSEISSKEIELKSSNTDIPHLLNTMPSVVSYSENGNWLGYSNMTIRGFDQRRIAVYINGIPQNDPEDHNLYWINYSDLYESIGSLQIQRGAGVANFGAASIGGAINIETSNFSQEANVRLYSGAGFQEFSGPGETKFNSVKNTIEMSSGLVDNKYAFYGKISEIRSDGYRNATWANIYSYFLSAVRYDENLTTQINVYGGGQRDGLAYYGLSKDLIDDPSTRLINFNNGEVEQFESPHFEILTDWIVNDDITVRSKLFYFEGKGYFDYWGAGWADSSYGMDPTNGFDDFYYPSNSMIRGWVGNKQWGWLPSIEWDHGNGNLLVGAEFRDHTSGHWGRILTANELPSDYDFSRQFFNYNTGSQIMSFFARERLDLSDDLSVSLDLSVMNKNYYLEDEKQWGAYRTYFNKDSSEFTAEGELFNVSYLFLNPRFGLNYKLNEKVDLYFSTAYTNRPPRRANLYDGDFAFVGSTPNFASTAVDTFGNVAYDFSDPNTDPESMLDIEFGSYINLDHTRISANVYWMEFFNELAYNGALNGYGAPMSQNIPRTRHYGIELNVDHGHQFTKHVRLDLNANINYSENFIVEYTEGDLDLSGNEIAGFPSYIFNTFWNLTIYDANIIMETKLVDDMMTDNFGDTGGANVLEGYFVMNAGLSYNFKDLFNYTDLRLSANVQNLLNEIYTPYGIGFTFFPAAERAFYLGAEISI